MYKDIKTFFTFIIITLSLLVCPLWSFAQDSSSRTTILQPNAELTLDKCIEITLQNNPSVAASFSTQYAQKSKLSQTKSAYAPQISGNANYSRSNSNSAQGNSGTQNNYSTSISGSQLIYDFGQTNSTVGIQQKSYDTAVQNTVTQINDTVYLLKQAYYAVLSAEAAKNVYIQSVEQYTEQLKRAQAFYEVGTYPKIDVTSAQVNLNDAKLNLITSNSTLETTRQNLLNVMGIYDPNPTFSLERKDLLPEFSITLEDALKQANLNRPDLAAQKLKVESARQNITLSKTGYAPQINANGSYGWSGGEFPLYDGWTVGAGVSIPIFTGLNTYNKVEEAKQNLQTAYHNLDELEQSILLEVKTAILALNNARERLPVAKLTQQQAKESYDLAVGRYKVGVGNYIEVKDAETTYSDAKLSYIQAAFDYNLAIAKLKNAMGSK